MERLEKLGYKKVFYLLLAVWFVVNIIQALVMDVISDEAYYGLWGKYLDWGYYDHPPFVALLVGISSFLFDGNLGIRFMTVLLQPLTLLLVWHTIGFEKPDVRKVITFFIISASIVMFVAYGIVTTPDVPLLFFTALFLFGYKRFLERESLVSVVLLTLSMAGLVYSKYQAVLVIGFTVLSNFKLLKSYKFWLAGLLALLLLTPHILWQVSNGFPSFQYHLVARSTDFKWVYLLEYFPNELAVFNPFTLGAVVYVLIKYRSVDLFRKNLYFQIIGFILFFWLTAFRGHVEPHWTIACSISMIILLSERCETDTKLRGYTFKYIGYSLLLVLVARIFLVIDSPVTRRIGYTGNDKKHLAIENIAGDLPVIFTGSFQRPSLYPFITGKEATVISSLYSRQTQFDIWRFEEQYQGKPAFIWGDYGAMSSDYSSGVTSFKGFFTDNLQTVNSVDIEFSVADERFKTGNRLEIPYTIINKYDNPIDFNHPQFPVELCVVIARGKEVHLCEAVLSEEITIIPSGEPKSGSLTFTVPDLEVGEYSCGLSLNTLFGPALNSGFVNVLIQK